MEQLTGIDSLLLYMEKKNTPMHIGGMLVFKPKTELPAEQKREKLLASLASRMNKAKVFKRKIYQVPLQLDCAYWVDDQDFDLTSHVKHLSLPKNSTRQILDESIARVYAKPLDMTKPLWEAWIIDGLGELPEYDAGCYGVLFKAHHAAIDGMSGAEIVAALCTPGESEAELTGSCKPAQQKPTLLEQLKRASANNMRRPAHLSKAFRQWRASGVADQERASETVEPASPWTKTVFNHSVSKYRNVSNLRVANSDLQKLRRSAPNTTLNHVALAVVAGGMRKYLTELNELNQVAMNTLVPISIRGQGDEAGGNLISLMVTSLATEIDDPLERLITIRNEAIKARNKARRRGKNTLATLMDGLHPMSMNALSGLVHRVTQRMQQLPTPVHTVVSNIPGPDMPLYMDGEELVDLMGLGLIAEPAGIFHAVVSYRGYTNISVLSCPEVLAAPNLYQQCMQASFDELMNAARAKSLAADIAPKESEEAAMLKTA